MQLARFYAAEVFFRLNAGPELAKHLYFMKLKETVFPFTCGAIRAATTTLLKSLICLV